MTRFFAAILSRRWASLPSLTHTVAIPMSHFKSDCKFWNLHEILRHILLFFLSKSCFFCAEFCDPKRITHKLGPGKNIGPRFRDRLGIFCKLESTWKFASYFVVVFNCFFYTELWSERNCPQAWTWQKHRTSLSSYSNISFYMKKRMAHNFTYIPYLQS